MADVLTSDNLQLSEPTRLAIGAADFSFETEVGSGAVSNLVAHYAATSLAPNTRRAYRCDLKHFEAWGGHIPSSPAEIANYLAHHADRLSVVSLMRRLAVLSICHPNTPENPARSRVVRATMRGIRRQHGQQQRRVQPLTVERLEIVLQAMGQTLADLRDRALLLLGHAAALRRSELVGLNVADVAVTNAGLSIRLRCSKTDQFRQGRTIHVSRDLPFHPVRAVEDWISRTGMECGPIFRPISRMGVLAPRRLSGEAVATIVKWRVACGGLNSACYSGHSLRAGYVTDAAYNGVPEWLIRRQTGHASPAMLDTYFRGEEIEIQANSGRDRYPLASRDHEDRLLEPRRSAPKPASLGFAGPFRSRQDR